MDNEAIKDETVEKLTMALDKWIKEEYLDISQKDYNAMKKLIRNTLYPIKEVYEIRIRRTDTLPEEMQKEIADLVLTKPEEFNYQGYCKITFSDKDSNIVESVAEPIEGTIINFYNEIMESIKK